MAHHKSAEKRIRQTKRRTTVNRNRTSRVKTYVRAVEEALASGNKEEAVKALRAAEPEIQRGAQHGVLHRNSASRKVSRLAKRVNAL